MVYIAFRKTQNMPYKAVYVIISAPRRYNAFMTAADLFEQGKVLGALEQITIDYKRRIDRTMKHAAKSIPVLREAYEAQDRIVSLVSLQYIASDNMVVFNKGTVAPYWNKEVRIISTGHKWFMLDDYLRSEGYTVKTNEHRFIVGVG